MKKIIAALMLAFSMTLAAQARAQDLETGVAAYQREDYAAAFAELKPLADAGEGAAQTLLGIMYGEGHYVVQDYAAAAALFRAAAVQAVPLAQHQLGLAYLTGDGVEQDAFTGIVWLSIAFHNGFVFSQAPMIHAANAIPIERLGEAESVARRCVESDYGECP